MYDYVSETNLKCALKTARLLPNKIFGGRFGVTLFLTVILVYSVFIRTGFVLNDSHTIANTLVGVADGHLHIGDVRYGKADTPGTHLVDGRLYGRNYGHVFFALPFLWALEGIAAITDLRIALAGAWSLLAVVLARRIGRHLDRPVRATVVGTVLAIAAFGLNLSVTTPIDPELLPLLALNLSTIVASAFAAVLLYRLLARMYSDRVGVFAALGTIVATGFGFWGTIPKRHAVVTALLLATVYSLYRSRESTTARSARQFRALAYVWVGFVTWINAMEGFVVFVSLLAVDLPTARSNDIQSLATVGVAFCLSLLPFFLTNYLVAGNPIEPPHLWPNYNGEPLDTGGSGSEATGDNGATSGSSSNNAGSETSSNQPDLVQRAIEKVSLLSQYLTAGLTAVIQEPLRLVATFIRSGPIADQFIHRGNANVELTMLETSPILGPLLALPVLLGLRVRNELSVPNRYDPRFAVDAFVVTVVVLFTLVYMRSLPVHVQLGVRYLLPFYALGMYGVVRLTAVRTVLDRHADLLCWTTAGGVLIGGQILFAYMYLSGMNKGELLQIHAGLGLVIAAIVAVWTIVSSYEKRYYRIGAICLGFALAAGTTFLVVTNLYHFAASGEFVLPAARWLTRQLQFT